MEPICCYLFYDLFIHLSVHRPLGYILATENSATISPDWQNLFLYIDFISFRCLANVLQLDYITFLLSVMQFPQPLYEFTFPPKVCQIPSSSHLQLYLSFCFTTIIDIKIVYYYYYYHFTITQSHSNWREVVFYYRFDL